MRIRAHTRADRLTDRQTHTCSGSSPCRYVRFANSFTPCYNRHLPFFAPFYTEEVYNCNMAQGIRTSTPRPLYFYDATDLPLLPKRRAGFLFFSLSRRKRIRWYPKLYLQIEKEERMYCKCNIMLEFFFLRKKLLGRSMVSERTVDAVHCVVRDVKNKRVEYIFLLYFL